MSEDEIKIQIALNEKLAESICEETARAAKVMVKHWEGKLADAIVNRILDQGYF